MKRLFFARSGRVWPLAIPLGCLMLTTAFGREAAPRADAESAVIFGTESTTKVGPPFAAQILRLNDEEYFIELHWAQRKFWRTPPGEVRIKLYCSVVYKAGFGRRLDGQYKLFKAKLEAGHYYQFTCEKFQPDYVDRGTDAEAIPELAKR